MPRCHRLPKRQCDTATGHHGHRDIVILTWSPPLPPALYHYPFLFPCRRLTEQLCPPITEAAAATHCPKQPELLPRAPPPTSISRALPQAGIVPMRAPRPPRAVRRFFIGCLAVEGRLCPPSDPAVTSALSCSLARDTASSASGTGWHR
jgi:hypothetical protein